MDGSDDSRFPLSCEFKPWITKYELCSSGFRYVLFFLVNYTTLRSTGGVLFLETVYFYCPKYGGRYWFKGPIRTIDDKDSGHTIIADEVKEMHAF